MAHSLGVQLLPLPAQFGASQTQRNRPSTSRQAALASQSVQSSATQRSPTLVQPGLHMQSKPGGVSTQVALVLQLAVPMAHSLGVQLLPLPARSGVLQTQRLRPSTSR